MAEHPHLGTAALLAQAADRLLSRLPGAFRPEVAFILGSGLGGAVFCAQPVCRTPYGEVPGLKASGVAGHAGELAFGTVEGKRAVLFSGRTHYYEGADMEQVVFPVRLSALLGARLLVTTAAVGALHPALRVGDIVVVRDHVNFMGANPLRGVYDASFGPMFPDLSGCYAPGLVRAALSAARRLRLRARAGTYFGVSGPSYETPAEVRAFRKLGGDVVGMSMAPEAVAACQSGLKVLGLAYVSNRAAGLAKTPLRHDEVLAAGRRAVKDLAELIRKVLQGL